MKTPILFLLPPFAQILLIAVLPFTSADLVGSTCNRTPYPVFCAAALRVDPRSSTADTKTLGLIMVDQVRGHAKSILTRIKYLRGKVPHPMTKLALSSCEHSYRIIISAMVPPSKEGLMKGDYKFTVEYMNAAANDALECEAGFGGSKSALSDSNDYVRKAALVASAIASLLL
ncbi:cell wall / vacuolar inhibitor of fructosidase 1-like [Rhodamnia argentea]|uniref:Cell wall / vacuolar inhibitor of fructosidase 1-like n=1 Tax=Rhodamnia argentea TaxID=178133 RepID=A0A8B8Q0B4_9MYRT|nr:cell wall / vacuolar inhibitor of fructosidase 1-like [Rhodamnia argentea]